MSETFVSPAMTLSSPSDGWTRLAYRELILHNCGDVRACPRPVQTPPRLILQHKALCSEHHGRLQTSRIKVVDLKSPSVADASRLCSITFNTGKGNNSGGGPVSAHGRTPASERVPDPNRVWSSQ